jgi:hypothetical protein
MTEACIVRCVSTPIALRRGLQELSWLGSAVVLAIFGPLLIAVTWSIVGGGAD